MLASVSTSQSRSIAHRLLVLVAGVLGLCLAFSGTASAQAGFQATVHGATPKPTPCANGDFFCGSASTNYGAATWGFNLVNAVQTSHDCGIYEATVTFVLGDASSSTLVLDENGAIYAPPGNSLNAPGGFKSFGNPFYFTGGWTVESATGQFGSIAVGTAGTDAIHAAGAAFSGTYGTT